MKTFETKNTLIAIADSFREVYSDYFEEQISKNELYKRSSYGTPDVLELDRIDFAFGTNDREKAEQAFDDMMNLVPPAYSFKSLNATGERLQTVKRRRKRRNEFDGEFCLDSVMSGDPRFYTKTTKVSRKDKTMSVLINISASAGVSAETIKKKLRVIIEKIDAYHNKGLQLEIAVIANGCNTFRNSSKHCISGVTIHKAGQAYNKNKLYTVMHEHILRTVLFRMYIMTGQIHNKEVRGSLGTPIHAEMNKEHLQTVLDDYKSTLNTDFIYYDLFGGEIK